MPKLAFTSLVLLEPMILPPPAYWPEYARLIKFFQASATHRRDVWASRADTLAEFRAKDTLKGWDARVVELYVVRGR